MAANLRLAPIPHGTGPEHSRPDVATALSAPAHAYLARLAALHDEAAETAHLANLLGRAPWAASALGAAALGAAAASAMKVSSAPLAVWLGLLALGIAAIARSYAKALEAPFDGATLKAFARGLSAMLAYAGAAWGAGVFLALPEHAGPITLILFIAAMSALIAAILRARDLSHSFVASASVMGAFCALMRDGNIAAAAGILAGGLLVAGAAILVERLVERDTPAALG